jgi:hypothetical protein
MWCISAVLVSAVTLALTGLSVSAAEERADEAGKLVVHEWGTFTTVSDSGGRRLRFYANDRDLPKFIYSSPRFKDEKPIFVSLETPVVYFYSERELTCSVHVDFERGRMTEWFPNADLTTKGGLSWPKVKIIPRAERDLPGSGDNRYFAARATDATPVELTTEKDGKKVKEREKFLFYRGVGDCATPLKVRALGKGKLAVTNTGKETITDAFLICLRGGKLRFLQCGSLHTNAEEVIDEPAEDADIEKLADAVVGVLTGQGLYEKEARAMVETWRTAWFGEEGTRILYLMPTATTAKLLPLRMQPKPTTLVRVLVGRHDVLTPERERVLDDLLRRVHQSRLESEQEVLRREVHKEFGRFAESATEAAETRLARRER